MDGADLLAGGPEPFAIGFLDALHHTAGGDKVACHFAQELIIGIDAGPVAFNGLAPAGIRKMVFDPLAVRLVGQPLPGEETLHRHHEIFAIGSNHAQKGGGRRGQILMDPLRAALIQNTAVHRLGR